MQYHETDAIGKWRVVSARHKVEGGGLHAANGYVIGDGGAFEKRKPNICTNAR